jgi:hypothetical protein
MNVHVARIEVKRKGILNYGRQSERNRTLGRPTRRWEAKLSCYRHAGYKGERYSS